MDGFILKTSPYATWAFLTVRKLNFRLYGNLKTFTTGQTLQFSIKSKNIVLQGVIFSYSFLRIHVTWTYGPSVKAKYKVT